MKLRMVRFWRELRIRRSSDPIWATESIGGMVGLDGRPLVTRPVSVCYILSTMGPSPEPNLTVLWSDSLPENFKKYCIKVSIDTSSIRYEKR